ncbi:hypothetical protein [Ferrovibrio sp.]|uniref:hypothetical protein n=1 Tax=Ferrovibrio sp. TaxID=1917215 RepID=UPI000CCB2539|nr:hypothetical protein [Ferrovibrio sp.]PJI41914.1 MAG: hypothetical protein CTR53_05515 [Ferrovibrio sp.]
MMSRKRILVFAAKDVGARLVRHLVENFAEDEYRFIVGEPGADGIAQYLASKGQNFSLYSDAAVEGLHAVPDAHFDWLLNLWGNHIFRLPLLAKVKRSLNIHPAYLPYGRGRDPVVWAIRREHTAGASLHEIAPQIDAGAVWARKVTEYELPCRGQDLYARVIRDCGDLFEEAWPQLRDGILIAVPQEGNWPTNRRKDLLQDRVIDVDADAAAREVVLKLMAHDFADQYSALVKLDGTFFKATIRLEPTGEG